MAEYPKWLCGRRNGLKFYYFRQDDIDNTFSVNLPFPPIFPVAYIKLLTFEQVRERARGWCEGVVRGANDKCWFEERSDKQ